MQIKILCGVAGLATLMLGNTAHASPIIGKLSSDVASPVQNVDYRRCWYRDGERHCRIVREYDYYGGPIIGFGFGAGRGFHGHRGHRH